MIHVIALFDAVKGNYYYNGHVRPNSCDSYRPCSRGL